MQVKEVMHRTVHRCQPSDNLEYAAQMMWENDCGAIPVVDRHQHPVGIITDRDITLAAAREHKPLWEMKAKEFTRQRDLYTCSADTDIHEALALMVENKIRRLPVVDRDGHLLGIVAMSDILHQLANAKASAAAVTQDLREALHAFNAITAQPRQHVIAKM